MSHILQVMQAGFGRVAWLEDLHDVRLADHAVGLAAVAVAAAGAVAAAEAVALEPAVVGGLAAAVMVAEGGVEAMFRQMIPVGQQ